MRGGAGAARCGTNLVSDSDGPGLGGEKLDGVGELSLEAVVGVSLCGTSNAGLGRASCGGRGRGSGAETALRG